jgi:hypothetical protein
MSDKKAALKPPPDLTAGAVLEMLVEIHDTEGDHDHDEAANTLADALEESGAAETAAWVRRWVGLRRVYVCDGDQDRIAAQYDILVDNDHTPTHEERVDMLITRYRFKTAAEAHAFFLGVDLPPDVRFASFNRGEVVDWVEEAVQEEDPPDSWLEDEMDDGLDDEIDFEAGEAHQESPGGK